MVYTDFFKNISEQRYIDVLSFNCQKCDLSFWFIKNNTTFYNCPYCLNNLKSSDSIKIIKPEIVLQTKINYEKAYNLILDWLNKDWFIDKKLTNYIKNKDNLKLVYIPFWLYDIKTSIKYKAQKGLRKKNKIIWEHIQNTINHNFNEISVLASKSFNINKINDFQPWNIIDTLDFKFELIDKSIIEIYSLNFEKEFKDIENIINYNIKEIIENDIESLNQKINDIKTKYNEISFKHFLIPLWVITYIKNDKTYRYIINSQTGEIIGEKIFNKSKLYILLLLIVTFILFFILK